MGAQRASRRRGAILTTAGYRKLQAARRQLERSVNFGERFTNEELATLTGLSIKTCSKLFNGSVTEVPVDKQTLDLCFAAFNLVLGRDEYSYPDGIIAKVEDQSGYNPSATEIDWGESPDVAIFYGRERELTQLAQWVNEGKCRLVAILGMGGMGKTALVTKLAQQLQSNFMTIVWRSLRNAPLLSQLLPELIELLSHHTEIISPTVDISTQISRLIHHLRQSKCLLVLDNAEAILTHRSEEAAGYAELFSRMGESRHQSCVLITSREKPEAILPFEGEKLPVRTFALQGLSVNESKRLFDAKGVSASDKSRSRLWQIYSGNPLALNIITTSIRDLFGGKIDEFLAAEVNIFNGLDQLISEQFYRLSPTEQTIMYWLAIDRAGVSLNDLHTQIVPAKTKRSILTALESLVRSSLVEQHNGKFTQQSVVMEYVTTRLIELVTAELTNWDQLPVSAAPIPLWLSYPLVKVQAPKCIQGIQRRLLLKPIAAQLTLQLGNTITLARQLQSLPDRLRTYYGDIPHYGGGNLINLCRYLQISLNGWDLSRLPLRQADLQNLELHDVNVTGADLKTAVFTNTFGGISCVVFSPNGELVATGECNGHISLRRVDDKSLFCEFKGHQNWVWSIAFSPDGQMLASGGQDGTIRLSESATGRVIHLLQVGGEKVLTVSFHPNGQMLATGDGHGELSLWNVSTGAKIESQSAHLAQLSSLRFSPNGTLLVTGSDNSVKIWQVLPPTEIDPASPLKCLQILPVGTSRVWSVRFSPDGQLIAIGSSDGTVQIWQVTTWQKVATFPAYPNWLLSISFSSDSRLVAVGNSLNQVKIWAIDTPETAIATLCGHTALVSSIDFSPDGTLLVTTGADRSIRLWETQTWHELHSWIGYANEMESIVFTPDGTQLIVGSQDALVRIWDVQTGNIHSTLTGHQRGVLSVDYNPHHGTIASASADGTVKVWHAPTGELIRNLCAHRGTVWKVQFSPDGQLLASSGLEHLIYLWSETGEPIATLRGHTQLVRAMVFTPDSKRLATGSFDGSGRLWEVATGKMTVGQIAHDNWIWDIAFSPNGLLVASASADRTAKLWDAQTRKLLHTLTGHTQDVTSVKFSPSGQQLATSSADGTIKLWDVETGMLSQTLSGHGDRVLCLSYHPHGQLLASGGADETVRCWDLTTGVCVQIFKPLSPYSGLNITGAIGLTPTTITALKVLGAISTDAPD